MSGFSSTSVSALILTEKKGQIKVRWSVTYEVNADSRDVAFGVCVIGESKQQARLPNTRVTNKEQFEQVIVSVGFEVSRRFPIIDIWCPMWRRHGWQAVNSSEDSGGDAQVSQAWSMIVVELVVPQGKATGSGGTYYSGFMVMSVRKRGLVCCGSNDVSEEGSEIDAASVCVHEMVTTKLESRKRT